ncbi:MAG: ABC transporter ATP-binding protein [Actinobacteria bacterium]|nr:ABC transporter ATP-binding protein [Actinomycetota bacterium]
MADPQSVICCQQLSKQYPGGILAVDRLDLSVFPGEVFGLLGPNGAGKTTTAGMLTTRVIPTGGRALVAGIDVVAHPAMAKQLIGVVPQTNTLDRSLTVRENLYFHGLFFGMGTKRARAAADYLLEQFRLADRANMPVAALSGGMAQRLMAARAIMHGPSVLFLDEPTAGLDPQSRIALWDILGELRDRGPTIFLSTHNMEEADQHCDRVAIMDRGRILAMNTPRALKASVGADTVVIVTTAGDATGLAQHLEQGVTGAMRSQMVGGKIHLHVGGVSGVLPQVVAIADDQGITVTDLSVVEPSLETVFINLTGRELRD